MISLNPDLLLTSENAGELLSGLKGSYNPMQFVLRLRKDIHLELSKVQPGANSSRDITSTQIQAYSTYLHETIHWWQHVGSNFGLISSLKFPAQGHIINSLLKDVLNTLGPFKSIAKFDQLGHQNENVNSIINYWHDIEFAGQIAFEPTQINKYATNPYFECWGHSYNMMWSASIWTLAATFDPELSFLPNIREWEHGFKKLKEAKVESFYYGSSNTIPPLGTRSIFEGQARFSQLQYLYLANAGTLDFNDFNKAGLLSGIYVDAFNLFLNILGEPFPVKPDDPLVGLFLLICDLAINPTDGFPFDLTYHESFILTNDPGFRFALVCKMIRDNHKDVKKAIQHFSKEEYIFHSEKLARSIGCFSPYESAAYILNWIDKEPSIKKLLEEERNYQYTSSNLPIRLFFSKFLKFQEDKVKYPQFFCWPGMHLFELPQNQITLKEAYNLFEKHNALFIDDENGDIYPSASKQHTAELLDNTLNEFFTWNSVYTMVREWIITEGPFTFDYQWLSSKYTKEEMKNWACSNFETSFGVHPESFKIL
ncbi:hypothetical protein CLV51_104150 [Chitinophaga niastensis]|uniref:Uncharacterized protein n=1 Tax=Chitinophaga niastensis TaxID=536980 RepID=A0A2P8HGV6_CHINA|nr:hypothetical protein [Chitinophaga niastensis]PSL45448.1 hypothetical protein CLV51_104150 [Chitinophaga niastensis]